MSGRVGDLSPKQADALKQFRERIQDILPQLPAQHDHFLLRWLRARNFNVQKSEAMLRKHLEFRNQMKVDTIATEWRPPEVIEKYLSGGMCGYDREGSPIWYDVIGPVDPKGLFMSASKQDFVKSKIKDCELLQKECELQCQRLGKHVEAITMIYDVEGLALKHLWKPAIETYGEIVQMFEDNYPEGLKRLFVIKAPKIFPVAYNLVKHFLSEVTRSKIQVLGENWQEVLLKYIDPEQLPVVYGGKMTDPDGDPRCKSRIQYAGPVPPSYYVRDHVKVNYDQCLTVGRGSSKQMEYEILFPGCVLRWQFVSDGGDIGFGVFLKSKKGEWQKKGQMQQVVCSQRYNSHLVPEDGSLTCEQPGIYVLRFDNTYSIFQSKRVSFSVEVLLPIHLQSPKANGGSSSQPEEGSPSQPEVQLQSPKPNGGSSSQPEEGSPSQPEVQLQSPKANGGSSSQPEEGSPSQPEVQLQSPKPNGGSSSQPEEGSPSQPEVQLQSPKANGGSSSQPEEGSPSQPEVQLQSPKANGGSSSQPEEGSPSQPGVQLQSPKANGGSSSQPEEGSPSQPGVQLQSPKANGGSSSQPEEESTSQS